MPVQGPASFFGGLPYWLKVINARWKRAGAIAALRREQQAEERRLEEILRDLGKRARALRLEAPFLEQPMVELQGLEAQRGHTEGAKAELAARLSGEKARLTETTAECQARIDEAQAQVKLLQASLKERQDERRAVRQRLAELERQIKLETGQRDRRRAAASKAKTAEQRQDLEQAAAELAMKIGDREREREAVQAEVAALDTPIAELQAELDGWRGRLATAQKDLAAARQELARREREIATEDRRLSLELAQRERALAEKFLELGKLLDSNRIQSAELEELYGRIGETRGGIEQRSAQAARLEEERRSYDPRAVKNGKIVFLSGLGLLIAVMVTLIILFAVVF
jgi:chromosome segregation ATPase